MFDILILAKSDQTPVSVAPNSSKMVKQAVMNDILLKHFAPVYAYI